MTARTRARESERRLELRYAGSAAGEAEYPRWSLPEIAVAGRSNAGKSSLLNRLGGRRDLARVSRTPGRTRRLHFFEGAGFALVDLPGFGFARASREARASFGRSVEEYLTRRSNLRGLLLLADVRRGPGDEEAEIERFAAARGIAVVRVATKVDKLGRAERARLLGRLERGCGPWIPFSARNGEGTGALVDALARLA